LGANESSRNPPRVTIVADDLTGTVDVAAPLADRGLDTRAVASACDRAALDGAEVVSINTDSRHLPPAAAAERVGRMSQRLIDPRTEILVKKVDSTLRGNVVAETLAMLDATGRRVALVAPGFPAQGRSLVDGVVHVQGVPLPQTSFAKDALSPPPREPVHVLFRTAAPSASVELLRRGEPLPALSAHGQQILVVDTATDEDLRGAIRAVQGQLSRVLLVGSAGIAHALADVCFEPAATTFGPRAVDGTVLFVVGSRAERSAQQVAALLEEGHAYPSRAPNGRVDVESAAGAGAPAVVIVAMSGCDGREGRADEVAERLGVGVAELLQRRRVSAVVATGGDTALAILQRLGVAVLRVACSLLPGIPISRIETGETSLWFVTKAGGFGSRDALVTIARRLRAGA